jgi:phage gpG-like protein
MPGIQVTITGEAELVAKFTSLSSAARNNVRDAVVDLQYRLQARIRELLSGEVLDPRTGNLRGSINADPLQDNGNEVRGTVSTDLIYAAIHEFGGTITPKTAQYLTIPLEAVLTAAGVARYSAREIIDAPSMGGFEGTFFAKGVLFGRRGRGDLTPLFALKTSVTLPARPYMRRGLQDIEGEVQERLARAIEEAVSSA